MPIRETINGWYWGSYGPFLTESKAIKFGYYAYGIGIAWFLNPKLKVIP